MRLEFRTDEQTYQLDVTGDGDSYIVRLGERDLELELLSVHAGEIYLQMNGHHRRAYVAARGDERYVFLAGHVHIFHLPADDEDAEDSSADGPRVTSQMPGTVVKIMIEPGAGVEIGDGLLIMESMKMETEISAPVTGSVSAIHVQTGQTVGMGDPLVDIDPETGTDGEPTT